MSRNFAQRVEYAPLQVEENTADLENDYLLGNRFAAFSEDKPVHKGLSSVVFYSNIFVLVLSTALLYFCITEGKVAGVRDPILQVGIGISVVAMANALVGFMAVWFFQQQQAGTGRMFLAVNHALSLLCMFFLILLAIATLLHWDMTGNPMPTIFLNSHSSGVKHRYVIWGLALATGLTLVILMNGVLLVEWPNQDDIYKWTVSACCLAIMAIGLTAVGSGFIVWYRGEITGAANPWSIFGSILAGAAFSALGFQGLFINSQRRLDIYLMWLPVVATALTVFSIVNTVSSEPDSVRDRRVHMLLSGLVGLWGQLITVVSLISATRWRKNLRFS